MRCLIAGGGGFIGSHVVEHLLKKGHELRVLDIRPNPYAILPSGVEWRQTDVNNQRTLRSALTGMDAVVHLMGTTWPGSDLQGIEGDIQSELMTSVRLFESCVKNGVQRIIFLSSGGTVYGVPDTTPIDENHPVRPICSYGVLKLAVEHYLHLFHHAYGLEYVILRGANIYGEGHHLNRLQGAVNIFLQQMALKAPIDIWGDGKVVRDYLYVGDMARAIGLALTSPLKAAVMNVGSGKGISLIELIEACNTETGMAANIRFLPGRDCDVPVNVLSIDKINNLLGWRPGIALSEGILRTWQWTRSIVHPS